MEQRSSKEEEGNLNFIRRGPSVSQTADELMLAPRTSLIFEKGLADRSCSLVSRFARSWHRNANAAGRIEQLLEMSKWVSTSAFKNK